MLYHLEIKVEAKNDIIEAAHWYSQKVKGLDYYDSTKYFLC